MNTMELLQDAMEYLAGSEGAMLTLEDICDGTGLCQKEALEGLDVMINECDVIKKIFSDVTFYGPIDGYYEAGPYIFETTMTIAQFNEQAFNLRALLTY